MHFKNTKDSFGIISIAIHWLMALLIIGLLVEGLYMTRISISVQKLKLYGLHKEFGVLVLMLVIVRLIWRIANTNPSLDSLIYLERLAARSMHIAFYILMFLLPITGWIISSAAGLPVSFFGLFLLPDLVHPDAYVQQLFTEIHQWLAYALILAISGHVAAALKHHFIDKDTILKRMLHD
jgi:cytochrome b561